MVSGGVDLRLLRYDVYEESPAVRANDFANEFKNDFAAAPRAAPPTQTQSQTQLPRVEPPRAAAADPPRAIAQASAPLYCALLVPGLKALLRERKLKVSGLKSELVQRLHDDDADAKRPAGLATA